MKAKTLRTEHACQARRVELLERQRSTASAGASSWEDELVTMQARMQDAEQQLDDEEQMAERYKQERDQLQREWDEYASWMPPDWQSCGDAASQVGAGTIVPVPSAKDGIRSLVAEGLRPLATPAPSPIAVTSDAIRGRREPPGTDPATAPPPAQQQSPHWYKKEKESLKLPCPGDDCLG